MISLVIGLGNLGPDYEGSRHNIGFSVVRQVQRDLKAQVRLPEDFYDWAVSGRDEGRTTLLLPRTLMNRSGLAARAASERFDTPPEQILVVCDDVNLPLGQLRVRAGGSDGGQKGLGSILASLGTEQIPRLRIGIGQPPEGSDLTAYVLDRFTADELKTIEKSIARAAEAVILALRHPLDEVMSQFNTNPAPTEDDNNV